MKTATLTDEYGTEIWTGSLHQFFRENEMALDEAREIIAALRPRDTGHMEPVTLGGGAAPLFELHLVA